MHKIKKSFAQQQVTQEKHREEHAWYELIPYGYGILEPGEWFWLTHRYPPSEEEADSGHTDDMALDRISQPTIRITFRARK